MGVERVISVGQVGPQGGADNQPSVIRTDRSGSLVTTQNHGQYYEATSRGNVFTATSASGGIAIIVPATTGGHPTLWNPLGSGVNVSVLKLELSYVSGTHAPGAFEWATTLNAGSTAATGAPILTATLVTPKSALIGGTGTAKALWSPTTNTFTAAPAFFRPVGFGLHTAAAATAINADVFIAEYCGDLVLAPGSALSLCYQTTTTTALFQVGVTWEEIAV